MGPRLQPAMQPPDVENAPAFAHDEPKRELEAVLSSEPFRRSERQANFLRFICQLTMNGEASKINEYLIAYEVFGRGSGYSPGEDSVVRRQAHSIRRKLQDYYAGEGSGHAIRIELPVGRYVPTFTHNDVATRVAAVEPAAPRHERSEPAVRPAPVRRKAILIGMAAALVGAGWFAGRLLPGTPQKAALPPGIVELWSQWLDDPSGASICFSNPMTAVVKQFSQPLPPQSLPHRIPMGEEEGKRFREALGLPSGGYLYLSPALSQAKMGEAVGAIGIASLFARSGVPIRAAQSRFVTWETFRNQNLILLGHDEANRWLDPLMETLPFRLAATEGNKQRRIVNTSPQAQERPEYQIDFAADDKDGPREDYALITMMKGIDGKHLLLLINGLNTEGTQAACEYLVNATRADELIAKLRTLSSRHHGPWSFQAVLRTEVHGIVPIKASLLVLRVLPQ
ncbi:MAG: hypothetical protein ACRD9L_05805 [Bryobacteraceae bacterium]